MQIRSNYKWDFNLVFAISMSKQYMFFFFCCFRCQDSHFHSNTPVHKHILSLYLSYTHTYINLHKQPNSHYISVNIRIENRTIDFIVARFHFVVVVVVSFIFFIVVDFKHRSSFLFCWRKKTIPYSIKLGAMNSENYNSDSIRILDKRTIKI